MVSKKLIFTLIFRKYIKNSNHLKHYLERTVKYEVDIDIISMIKSFFCIMVIIAFQNIFLFFKIYFWYQYIKSKNIKKII